MSGHKVGDTFSPNTTTTRSLCTKRTGQRLGTSLPRTVTSAAKPTPFWQKPLESAFRHCRGSRHVSPTRKSDRGRMVKPSNRFEGPKCHPSLHVVQKHRLIILVICHSNAIPRVIATSTHRQTGQRTKPQNSSYRATRLATETPAHEPL
jgi:hypothetical protein